MSPDKLTQQQIADQLARMSHHDLLQLRNTPNTDQQYLAPFEHRAFARETVQDNPLSALGLGVAIPAWEIAKLLSSNNLGSRSKPSLGSALNGYYGVAEGLGIAPPGAIPRPGE